MANEVKVSITIEEKQALKALTALTKKTQKFGNDSTKSFKKASAALDVFKGSLAAAFVTRGIDFAARSAREASRNFFELSTAIAEINSILPKNEKLTQASTDALIKFSDSFAGTAQTQAKAFYSIVSAGVKTTVKQLKVLRAANKAAVAGLVDISTSATVLVSSVNAYAKSALTATQASDALFIAVREGQTTFGELASGLGSVAPLASAAGISFDEMTGTLAFVTKSGVRTDEAITGLRATIAGIIKPAEQAAKFAKKLGIDFSTAAIRAKGFGKFMEEIKDATGGSEVALAKLFPNIRALGAVINITRGNFDDFKRILKETADSAGATSIAFEVMSKSAAFQFERLLQQLENLPQSFLKNFDEPIAQAIKAIREFVGTEGILLVAGAVEATIEAFILFRQVTGIASISLNVLSDVGLGTVQTFVEITNGINSAAAALKRFVGFTTDAEEKVSESNRKNLEGIEEARAANQQEARERKEQLDTQVASLREFLARIKTSKEQQVADNKIANEAMANSDKERIEKQIEAETERFDTLKLLRDAEKEQDTEEKEIKKLELELEDEELFQKLEAGLGRERALREIHGAKVLAGKGKQSAAIAKLRKADNAAQKKDLSSLFDFEKNTNAGRAANMKSTLGTISTLQSENNSALFAVGKAAAIATATIDGIAAVQKALAAAPPPFNFILAGLVGVATAANLAKITSAKPPGKQGGGIIAGAQSDVDNQTIRAAGGEMVLNRRQQLDLFNAVANGNLGGGNSVVIQGNVIADDEDQVNSLIDRINDQLEFRNATLRT